MTVHIFRTSVTHCVQLASQHAAMLVTYSKGANRAYLRYTFAPFQRIKNVFKSRRFTEKHYSLTLKINTDLICSA